MEVKTITHKHPIMIGDLIKKTLKDKGLQQTWLAEKLNISRQGLNNILSKNSMDTDQLYQISQLVSRDFFNELSFMTQAEIQPTAWIMVPAPRHISEQVQLTFRNTAVKENVA